MGERGESLAPEKGDEKTLGSSILLTGRLGEAPQTFRPPPWIRKFQRKDFQHRPIRSYEYGYWWFEWGGHLDTVADSPTKIRHELLRIALGVWDYVKNFGDHPEAANWTLDWVGSLPGKRESRRFRGRHVLTEQDVCPAAFLRTRWPMVAGGSIYIPPWGSMRRRSRPASRFTFRTFSPSRWDAWFRKTSRTFFSPGETSVPPTWRLPAPG